MQRLLGPGEACPPRVRTAMESQPILRPMWHWHSGAREHDTHLEKMAWQWRGGPRPGPSEARLWGPGVMGSKSLKEP